MINSIIEQLIEAQDCITVERIQEANLFKVLPSQRAHLNQFCVNAKKRIVRINREKKESFKDILN